MSNLEAYEGVLRNLQDLLREAVSQTMRLDVKWNKINEEINHKMDREGITDVVQRTKIKGNSLALQDALSAGNWWRNKANYLATIIQAEIAMQHEFQDLARVRRIPRHQTNSDGM